MHDKFWNSLRRKAIKFTKVDNTASVTLAVDQFYDFVERYVDL